MSFYIKKSDFVKSATEPSHYPDDIYPEYFFAGKSNSGKSSMLNKICNRKNLAITSKTPGRTQLINFFLINDKISFVDLPGYGYASTTKNIYNSWEKMVINYIDQRKKITRLFLVVDIRRGIGNLDIAMINLCKNFNINIIMTKSDKLSKSEKTKIKLETTNFLSNFDNISNIQTFSSKNGDGVSEILDIIKNSS